jgi:hypothetical protein
MLRITIVLPTPLGPSRIALTPSSMKPSERRSSTASLSIFFGHDQSKSAMALKAPMRAWPRRRSRLLRWRAVSS